MRCYRTYHTTVRSANTVPFVRGTLAPLHLAPLDVERTLLLLPDYTRRLIGVDRCAMRSAPKDAAPTHPIAPFKRSLDGSPGPGSRCSAWLRVRAASTLLVWLDAAATALRVPVAIPGRTIYSLYITFQPVTHYLYIP